MEERQKIIDMRLRPPFRSILKEKVWSEYCEFAQWNSKQYFGVDEVSPALVNRSMEEMVQEMDEAGVDIGVVAFKQNATDNDDIERLVESFPGRFLCLAGLNPFDVPKSLDYIERYVVNGKAVGVNIDPGQGHEGKSIAADDKRIYPLYEYCQSSKIPFCMTFGGQGYIRLENYNPLYIDHVAIDFPDLKLVLCHGGWPHILEMCEIALRRENVFLSPDNYLQSVHAGYQDYVTAANHYLQDKILFGSAYPIGPKLKTHVDNVLKVGLRPEVINKVMYLNAARVFGLEPEDKTGFRPPRPVKEML